MKETEKIYLDQKGYQQYLQEIEDLKERLNENNRQKSSAYTNAVGDGWHDNFEFEEAKREEFKIMGLLRDKVEGLSRIVIIDKNEKSQNENDLVDIDDYVSVLLLMPDDETEHMVFRLVASLSTNRGIKEVSLNSPMGKAVYGKKVGETGKYQVNGNAFLVQILAKSKDLTEDLENNNSLKR